jgi:putative sterol carrier protein
MTDISIQSLMDRLCGAFVPERSVGIDAIVQFDLQGDQGGEWVVSIQDQTCQVEQGKTEDANLTFSAQAQDALDVLSGKTDPMGAFMRGKLRLAGDMGLAMRLAKLFDVKRL